MDGPGGIGGRLLSLPWPARVALALLVVALATIARAALATLLPSGYPFITYFPAVAIAAAYTGLWPSLLAAVVSYVVADWLFTTPTGTLALDAQHLFAGLMFLVLSGVVASVSEGMRRSETALRASRAGLQRTLDMLAVALDAGSAGAWEWDLVDDVMTWTDGLYRLLGIAPGAVMPGWGAWRACIHPDDVARVETAIEDARARRSAYADDYRVRRRDGEVRWLHARARFALAPDGTPRCMTGAVIDITERRLLEEERERLLAQERAGRALAEEASRAKDEFLANVSHELRTPLSPILAWSRLLQKDTSDPQRTRRALETIERCALAQAQLIEDLLDVSRIVAGRLRLDVQSVDPVAVIEAALHVVRPAADARQIRLQVALDPRTGTVAGDPARLQQVVWNLLSNAVKFTPKGGRVQVTLARVNSHLEIAVADSGKGIAPAFLPRVFERFQQADQGTTREHAGLGLGLAIVRHLVELHGGTVHAESDGDGRGAVFTVKLPLVPVERRASEGTRRHPQHPDVPRAPTTRVLRDVKVLVVDDEPDSNEVVRTVLASAGAEVRTAASVAQAMEILGRWTPDVVVSDVGMPGEDGYALIRRMHGHDGRARRVPAVAFTAYASVEDRIRLLSAGFSSHIAKPLDPDEMVAVVAAAARAPAAPPA
jgi:PAS domain S-box-containing protein